MTSPPLPGSFLDAARIRREVEAELRRICASPQFRTSRRSCEFLRYIVQVTLDGRTDSLKERTIGIDLLHRDLTYDPSFDATVRVRANDVRKRLALFYGLAPSGEGRLRIDLAAGTYVPQFLAAGSDAGEDDPPPEPPPPPPGRRLRARPVAAGLAAAVLLTGLVPALGRLRQEDNAHRFWARLLADKRILLLSVPDRDRSRLASGLFPVVWTAGRFGVPTVLTGGSLTGATTATFAKVRISSTMPVEWRTNHTLRWMLDASAAPILAVRDTSGRLVSEPTARTALLTILPESPSILYVQSTDEDALRKIFELLTSSADFPALLAGGASRYGPAQILLRVDIAGHAAVQSWTPGEAR